MLRGVVFWLMAIIPLLASIASPKLRVDSCCIPGCDSRLELSCCGRAYVDRTGAGAYPIESYGVEVGA